MTFITDSKPTIAWIMTWFIFWTSPGNQKQWGKINNHSTYGLIGPFVLDVFHVGHVILIWSLDAATLQCVRAHGPDHWCVDAGANYTYNIRYIYIYIKPRISSNSSSNRTLYLTNVVLMALPDGISSAMSAIWRSSFLREAPQSRSSHWIHIGYTRWNSLVVSFQISQKAVIEMCPHYQQSWTSVGHEHVRVSTHVHLLSRDSICWNLFSTESPEKFTINQTISEEFNRSIYFNFVFLSIMLQIKLMRTDIIWYQCTIGSHPSKPKIWVSWATLLNCIGAFDCVIWHWRFQMNGASQNRNEAIQGFMGFGRSKKNYLSCSYGLPFKT